MKYLVFVICMAIIKCAASYPTAEKVGAIYEGPDSVIIVAGPDGSVIKSFIKPAAVVTIADVVIAAKPPSDVELINESTTTENKDTKKDESSTEEIITEEDIQTDVTDSAIAKVLQEEEKLKIVQENEVKAQKEAHEKSFAEIEAQRKSAYNFYAQLLATK